jgi:hypothetical protein
MKKVVYFLSIVFVLFGMGSCQMDTMNSDSHYAARAADCSDCYPPPGVYFPPHIVQQCLEQCQGGGGSSLQDRPWVPEYYDQIWESLTPTNNRGFNNCYNYALNIIATDCHKITFLGGYSNSIQDPGKASIYLVENYPREYSSLFVKYHNLINKKVSPPFQLKLLAELDGLEFAGTTIPDNIPKNKMLVALYYDDRNVPDYSYPGDICYDCWSCECIKYLWGYYHWFRQDRDIHDGDYSWSSKYGKGLVYQLKDSNNNYIKPDESSYFDDIYRGMLLGYFYVDTYGYNGRGREKYIRAFYDKLDIDLDWD